MKIVSYNILTGGIFRCGDRREAILKTLKEINRQKMDGRVYPIDILALQEANGFDSENKEFMQQIAMELDFDHAVVSKTVKWEGDGLRYNTAIYSRYPLKEVHDFYPQLSVAGLCVAIDSEEFGRVGILSQHLYVDSNVSGEDQRLQELDITLSFMKRFDRQIIMGDFNSISKNDNYVIQEMDDVVEKRFDVLARCEQLGYTDSTGDYLSKDKPTLEQLRTYPSPTNDNAAFKKPVRIDYILLKNLSANLKAAGIVRSNAADASSDHYPVWAILK